MKKRFLINIVFLVALNLLVKPFWIFGIDRTVQNVTGSDAYGLYFALFNFSFLFHSFLDAGITNYNNQSVSKNQDFIQKNFGHLAGLKIYLGFIYLTITLFSSLFLQLSNTEFTLLLILAFNQFILSFILFLRSNISGLQIFWLDSLLSVLDRFILIAICSVLLWGNVVGSSFKIEWLAYSQLGTYSVTGVICLAIVWSKSGSFISFPKHSFILSTLKKSLPFALIILFMSMYFRVDAVMIKELLNDGDYAAGQYAQGYRFLDMLNNFVFLFTSILFPMLSKEIAQKTNIKSFVGFGAELLLVPSVFILALAAFFNKSLMALSYTDVSNASIEVFSILLTAYIPLVLSAVYGTVLTAGGALKAMLIVSGISFLGNIILNYLLLPKYGIQGAAWASLLTQTTMAIGCYILASNKFKTHFSQSAILRVIMPIGAIISFYYFFEYSEFETNSLAIIVLSLSLIHPVLFSYSNMGALKGIIRSKIV